MVDGTGLKFGDILLYHSCRTQKITPCIFVRSQKSSKAVVLFRHAERVTKVGWARLTDPGSHNNELDKLFDEYSV